MFVGGKVYISLCQKTFFGVSMNIDEMCLKLSLPSDVCRRACEIFEEVRRRGVADRTRLILRAAASIYAACREMCFPVVLGKVAFLFRQRRRTINRVYRMVVDGLGIKPSPSPICYVETFAKILNIPEEGASLAKRICGEVAVKGREICVAAACIYISMYYLSTSKPVSHITQYILQRVTGISEPTLRSCIRRVATESKTAREIAEKVMRWLKR